MSVLALLAVTLLSYFGSVNPNPLGLISGIFIFCTAVAMLWLVGGKRAWLGNAASYLVVALFLLLTVSNWWHFQYFQSYFNYEATALIGDAPEALKSVSQFEYSREAVVLAVVSLLPLVLAQLFSLPLIPRSPRVRYVGAAVFFAAALVSGGIFHSSVANYKSVGMFSLSPAYFHPVHAFFTSMSSQQEHVDAEFEALNLFRQANRGDSTFVERNNKNIIVITLESVRASQLDYYAALGGKEGIAATPVFNAFAANNISAKNFYANTNFTVKGEMAIWCGLLDRNAKPPLSTISEQLANNLPCLPSMLRELGYDTRFYHGYQSRFYNRRAFLPKVGFENSLFFADVSEGRSVEEIGWGISDEAMLGLMLDELQSLASPFFAHITTLSSHYPFHWQWPEASQSAQFVESGDKLYDNYRRAVAYEDYAFGKFWEAFQRSPLAENTIVVVTADHGVWTFSPEDAAQGDNVVLDEKFFRLPLAIYHPDVDEPQVIEQVSSQIDIAPTLLAMLGLPHDEFVGKNMLTEVERPWALMMKSGQLVVRVENMLCRINGRECAGLHQECIAHQFGELFLKKFTDMQACYNVDGDLLQGGTYSEVAESEPWLQHGFNLINYHNKRALGATD
mgnify:CR=1 FL=1